MTRTHALETEGVILFALAAAVGVAFAFYFHPSPNDRVVENLPVVAPIFASPTPTPLPTPKVTSFTQTSSDGNKEVVMKQTVTRNGTSYVFTVQNPDGSNQLTLYTANLPTGETMSIPFNTFSSSDTYVFLQENTASGTSALAFRTDGQPLPDGSKDYNVTDDFNHANTGNTYQETTGWASDTLLVINTKTPSGSLESYWFDMTSKSIIPLATTFQ